MTDRERDRSGSTDRCGVDGGRAKTIGVSSHTRREARNGWKIALGSLVLLVLLGCAGAASFTWYLGASWDSGRNLVDDPALNRQLSDSSAGAPADEGRTRAAVNVLLLGSDSRSENVAYAQSVGFRTDAIIVAHIPVDRSGIQFVSIPRDSWVDIDGHGEAKINAAAAFGGLPLALATVSNLIDADIDHVVVIDFAGFEGLTNALGGVEVHSPYTFTNGGFEFVKGLNRLDGAEALEFVRARKQFPDGDLQRIRNQQEYLRAVGFELLSADVLLDPRTLSTIVRDFSPYLTVDSGLDAKRLVDLGADLRGISDADIDFVTAPISGAGVSADGQQYLEVDADGLEQLRRAFATDGLAKYAFDAAEQQR